MKFTPLSPQKGVRVEGLDTSKPIDAATALELKSELHRHRILLVRDGPMTEVAQVAIMQSLGNVIVESLQDGGFASYVSADPNDNAVVVGGTCRLLFHADGQITKYGALEAISLHSIEMERSEPTIFADVVRAARVLPAQLRARIEGRDVVQCIDFSRTEESKR